MYLKTIYKATVYVDHVVHGRLDIAADDAECAKRAANVWANKHEFGKHDVSIYVDPTTKAVWVP